MLVEQELKDKIMRKNNVMQQMRDSSIKFDMRLMQELQNEVVELSRQADGMECLIEDMDAWFNHKGLYSVAVSDCLLMPERHPKEPTFVIDLFLGKGDPETVKSNRLVINRKLSSLLQLQINLATTFSWLKKFEMPKVRKFRSYDAEYFSEAKVLVDSFLNALIADPVKPFLH